MHRDFHYLGTYLAARHAGFSHALSLKLGEYAELVDETWNSRNPSTTGGHKNYVADHDTHFYWKPEDFFGVKHRKLSMKSSLPKVQRTVTAVMSSKMMQKGEGRTEWFILSWSAFHFLPNLDSISSNRNKSDYWRKYAFVTNANDLKNNKDDILQKEQMLICYPESTLAKAMIEDTKKIIDASRNVESTNHKNWMKVLGNFIGKKTIEEFTEYVDEYSSDEFITALVGVRMHVLADLWAHQGFAAARSPRINDVFADSFHVSHSDNKWHREVDATSHKKSFSVKDKVLPSSHYGHGNAYTYPDLPSYRYRYIRPFDLRLITRDNPSEFAKAFAAMLELLLYFNKKSNIDESGIKKAALKSRLSQADFWRNHFIENEKDAHEKKPRNRALRQLACAHLEDDQKKDFIKDDANPDFGLIEHMHERRKKEGEKNLAYFSLAALYHLRWFNMMMSKPTRFGGNYPAWANKNLQYKPDYEKNFLAENFIKVPL